jgi:hypothetical protein
VNARVPSVSAALGPAALAGVLALAAVLLGLSGTDQAAQVYRVIEVRHHGLALFDLGWYGGTYPFGYSVVFPVVGALIGLKATAVILAIVATWAFDRLVTGYLGQRTLGSWYFAVSTLLQVVIGRLPFLAGEAFALLALLALTRGRRRAALLCGVLAALSSPLAAAFLAMACVAWAWRTRSSRWWPVLTAAASMGVVLALGLVFPGEGYMPFPWTELVMVLLFCLTVATPLVETTPAVRMAALLYAISSVFSFLVPNPLGGNAGRLAESIGVPLLACFATAPERARRLLSVPSLAGRVFSRLTPLGGAARTRPWQAFAAVVLVPFAVWQWAPGLHIVTSASAYPSSEQAFYQPLISRLAAAHSAPMRIEIVPTAQHWEAAYVAPSLPLARGWERQIDTARNPIFYDPGALTARAYERWLVNNGVQFVALPNAPLDYAGRPEAALIRSGRVKGLRLAWASHNGRLWVVTDSPGLVSGPATVRLLTSDHVSLDTAQPGAVTLRVRYTSLWSVQSGHACVSADPLGWTHVDVSAPGPVTLTVSVIPHAAPICGAAG